MSVIGWEYTCLDCGGDIAVVNRGVTHGHVATAVYSCGGCDAEWLGRVNVTRVGNVGASAPGERLPASVVAARAAEAHRLIRGGQSVAAACRAQGIDRRSYLARYGSTP